MPSKILIVEDDRATRMGLQELLRQAGYEVIIASDFRAGRRALEDERPDLLIADLRLEGFNGLQLLHVNPHPTPAIIVTGYPDDVLQEEARRLGAEYLLKPVPPPVLLAAIERLLAGPDRQERRRWPRKRLTIDVPVEVDDVPARVIDIGYGGAQVEVFRPGAAHVPPQLRLTFPVNEVALEADLVWGTPERAGRWLCGVAVRPTHEQVWRDFVDSL
ncbi:MAG TPA: response regulator [Vicinamibacterales bacterium]|nr:response regulator [Vicinamibacterales bacterium]